MHVINLEYPKMPLKTTADLENRRLTVSFYNNSPATMAELICAALKLKCTQQNNIWMISRTLRQLIVGWLLLLVALIPMNAQNGNVTGTGHTIA